MYALFLQLHWFIAITGGGGGGGGGIMSHNFPTSTLREGVMAHNHLLHVWDLDTRQGD